MTTAADYPGFNWWSTFNAPIQGTWDPTKGTDVMNPAGSWQHFDTVYDANGNPLSPKSFISDSFAGGGVAANPGTPEFEHYHNVMNTNTNQSAIQIAALLGGAAFAGTQLPSFEAAGTPFQAAGEYGATSGLPGAIPSGAYQASGEYGSSVGGSIPGAALQASGDFGGGDTGASALFGEDPGAGSGGGFFSKLGDYLKGGSNSPGFSQLAGSGQQQQQSDPMLNMMMAALVNRKPYVPAYEMGRQVYPMGGSYGR